MPRVAAAPGCGATPVHQQALRERTATPRSDGRICPTPCNTCVVGVRAMQRLASVLIQVPRLSCLATDNVSAIVIGTAATGIQIRMSIGLAAQSGREPEAHDAGHQIVVAPWPGQQTPSGA
jgi:hypothetical protein